MGRFINEMELYRHCPYCGNSLILATIDNQQVKKCQNCEFIFWNNPKPVVSIVIHKNGKVLLLKRTYEPFKNYWVLPGGYITYSETPQAAVKREAKEEAGIEVEIQGIVGVYRIDNDPRGVGIDIIFYGTTDGVVTLSNEDTEWKYFSPSILPERIAYKHREAIEEWHENKG